MKLENQHNGVKKCSYEDMIRLMPDVKQIIDTFPYNPRDFTWDVKVHMLMPHQFPCIPNWHYDCVPRDHEGQQDFSKVNTDHKMYLWLSGGPFTEFKVGDKTLFIKPKTWFEFTQMDEHRGTVSEEFTWRCFIRATDKRILAPKPQGALRRHSQVYLDSEKFMW